MDKKLSLKLNGGRHAQGILFMNLVIDECVEMQLVGNRTILGLEMNFIKMLSSLKRI
ncbi:unnamed protein product [Nyctereutes procyonoides]|uniref:(raccoon dog) hypothetical protein n=1 Tax=Nyctereutes procyonoides TaxID=34880 RepID=A0A811ZGK6_NYCPR|nr:unnamed protein product [Nyctereutes procyonoides]